MPIYEYRCEACGHELDVLQKLGDDPLEDCPQCSGGSLRRLISAPAFRLKGNGWYETDFKSDKEAKRNLADRPVEDGAAKDGKGEEKKGKDAKTAGGGNDAASSVKQGERGAQSKEKGATGSAGKGSGTEAA